MEDFLRSIFDNRFFQLPFLEALAYIGGVLLIGAIIVGIVRRMMGGSSEPSNATPYSERPKYAEDTWEWRKAA